MKIPQYQLDRLPATVREMFLRWNGFMEEHVVFNRPESEIHAMGHCERVLLYALIMGNEIAGDDNDALEALAHAAVFHDTRRLDDYLDTGHGARAAVYYEEFCSARPDMVFHPETVFMMRYHDLDDRLGRQAIREHFAEAPARALLLYDIFKDADALDRWRLGHNGLDARYLRTEAARALVDYARDMVASTLPAELLARVEDEVDRAIAGRGGL